jgi:hypothetical protein
MLHCITLMGALFVSDGQIMIAADRMTRVERAGPLLLVGHAGREDRLDVSAYPEGMPVHEILTDCATRSAAAAPAFTEGVLP